MSIPTWFDYEAYFQNKLATMAGYNELTLMKAFADAQYPYTAEGMYQHYVDHGQREGIAPNDLFNAEQYLYAKAAEWLNIAVDVVTPQHLKSLELQLEGANLTPLQHFQNHWSEYYATEGKFLNPSDNFNVQKYMEDKLDQMKAEDPAYTMQDLVAAFTAAGLDPITHYFSHGQEEGLTITPASASGKTIFLENDEAFGTIGNDSITAKLDVLNDHSYIDGGAGNDILMAYVSADTEAIRPEIYNVEKIILSQKNAPKQTGDNAVGEEVPVSLDAGKIQGMTMLVNADSRASLYVEDVRTLSTDMTIVWQDSDPGMNLNYGVYFDDVYLVSQAVQRSGTIRVELMDVKNSEASETHSLQDNVWNTISFDLVTASGTQTVTLTAATGYNGETATINTFFEALRTALNSSEWSDLITISLEAETYTGTASSAGNNWRFDGGHRIVFSTDAGTIDETSVNWSFGGESVVPGTGGIAWGVLGSETESCPLIQTNIHLDNVGRVLWDEASTCLPDERIWGSESGDMIVGGMGDRGGVERFDVTVDEGSWLSSLSSTNNTLRLVTVKNGVDTGFDIAPSEGPSVLFIGSSLKDNAAENVDQNLHSTPGSFTELPFLLSNDGLVDVKHFDASDFNGTVNLGASITAESYVKYLKDVDGQFTMTEDYAPNGSFNYFFGDDQDVLNLSVNSGVANDQDFYLQVKMGDGADFVNFFYENGGNALTTNQIYNMAAQVREEKAMTIDGGAGDDTIKTWGDGAIYVTGGAGNDAIYVGQNADDQNAVFVFNIGADASDRAIRVDEIGEAQPLNNDIGSTHYSFNIAGVAGETLTVTVTYAGISATVDVLTLAAATGTVTAQQINEAVAAAIAGNEYLRDLFVAKDGAGYSLMIQALFDGTVELSDFNITFGGLGATPGNYGTLGASYGTNAGYATMALVEDVAADIGTFTLGSGAPSEFDVTLDSANLSNLAVGDSVSITVDGVVYTGQVATAGDQDDMLVEALTNAADADGTLLSTIWTFTDGGSDATDGVLDAISIADDVPQPVIGDVTITLAGAEVTGTDTGTRSYNVVNGGAGNDTLVLNVGSDVETVVNNETLHNVVELSGNAIGQDVIVNFDFGDNATATVDIFDATAYNVDEAQVFHGQNVATMPTGQNPFTAANLATLGLTVTGGATGIAFVQHDDTNLFTVIRYADAAGAGSGTLAESEITVLGTVTFANGQNIGSDFDTFTAADILV